MITGTIIGRIVGRIVGNTIAMMGYFSPMVLPSQKNIPFSMMAIDVNKQKSSDENLSDVHVTRVDDKLTIAFDMPGFNKEDISLMVYPNSIHVKSENKENKRKYERNYQIENLSDEITSVDKEKISATYKNGVLTVEMPLFSNSVKIPVK